MIEQAHRDPGDRRTDDQHAEAAPAPLHEEHDGDHEHDARGDHLGDADDDLLHLSREPGHGLDEIGLHPAHGAIGDRREDHADEHERAADEQPEHVAGRPHALRAFDFDIDRAEVRTRAPCELLP